MSGLAQAMAPSKCPFFPIALNPKLCSSSDPAAFSLLQAVSPASAQQFIACWILWPPEVFKPLLHCVGQGRPHLPPGPGPGCPEPIRGTPLGAGHAGGGKCVIRPLLSPRSWPCPVWVGQRLCLQASPGPQEWL